MNHKLQKVVILLAFLAALFSFSTDAQAKKPKTLRVLYWNIQNGMWADQADNYDNFVAWVKKYNPDVCVWCEATSNYKSFKHEGQPDSLRYLPVHWPELAARYGHKYAALGGFRDNYPQEITSKYPIKTILKITDSDVPDKPVSHGAAIQQITVKGRTINFVTLHLWPQAYAFGANDADARKESSAKREGDYYRAFELKYVIDHTVNDPSYASQTDWLVMGDFNSRSRVDNYHYGYPEDSSLLLAQDQIRNNTDLKDIIALKYPGEFKSSTLSGGRIDYMYASPSMYDMVKHAEIVIDDWTTLKVSRYTKAFDDPSDHRPILVDFILK
jgi:endonuclease/exonuclease/phosphatase family metal-dependent hydrolase